MPIVAAGCGRPSPATRAACASGGQACGENYERHQYQIGGGRAEVSRGTRRQKAGGRPQAGEMACLQDVRAAVASGRILSDVLPDFREYRGAVAARTECNGRGSQALKRHSRNQTTGLALKSIISRFWEVAT